jgi:hypothetical protein
MTSSGTSTERRASGVDSGFQPWHFFMLLAMLGATAAVWRSKSTHPAALLLLSAAVIAMGLAGLALYHALAGFLGGGGEERAVSVRERDELEREKALVLRSIKELEFDRGMGKVNDKDYAEIGGRLRAHAMEVMQAIEAAPSDDLQSGAQDLEGGARGLQTPGSPDRACAACGTTNDADAKFCKHCGQKL